MKASDRNEKSARPRKNRTHRRWSEPKDRIQTKTKRSTESRVFTTHLRVESAGV